MLLFLSEKLFKRMAHCSFFFLLVGGTLLLLTDR